MENNILAKQYTNQQWDAFVSGTLLSFMEANGLEKVVVEDGSGKKAVLKKNAKLEIKKNVSFSETL